ncbi:MAG: glycine cleavage system protein GcvH [Patescibacteria group bacterium]
MPNPSDRKYTKEHEWIKLEADGTTATCGITDHAQHLLTDIVFTELPSVGKPLEAGKPCCVVESVKSVSDVYAPVGGAVTEANKALESAPQNINNDPYNTGWIWKMRISNPAELNVLMTADQYEAYIQNSAH